MDTLTISKADLEAIVRSSVSTAVADKMLEANEKAREANAREAATKNADGLRTAALRPSVRARFFNPDSDPHKGKGLGFARCIKALAVAKMDGIQPESVLKGWGDEKSADLMVDGRKMLEQLKANALGESVFADGGALVPDEYSAEFIEILRARAVVRGSGARTIPMNRGSLSLGKQTGAGTANYAGENVQAPISKQAFGNVQLSAKKLVGITPVSNDLIRDAAFSAEMLVRDDLVKVVALREDLAFIRGDGTQLTPKGIANWMDSANNNAATQAGSAATAAEVLGDLSKMIMLVEESNVGMISCGFLMRPRSKWYLAQLRDSVGGFIFRDEIARGTVYGYGYKTTTQIPNNLGGGANASEVYFGDFSEALIGENTTMLVDAFPNGTYYDSVAASIVSGISNDQTVLRVIERHDFALRHTSTFAMLNSVKWGV